MEDFDIITYLAVGVVLMCASALQGAVGFAAGLFGIPLLMMVAGMELQEAIMTMLLASFLQNLGGLYHLRDDVNFQEVKLPMVIRLATLPLGLLALHFATSLPKEYVKAVIGVVILVLVILQGVLGRSKLADRDKPLHWGWTPVAFGASGFLVGFCGMGGPPMVLWVMAQPWSGKQSRAFLFFLFTSSLPLHCLFLWWQYGNGMNMAMLMALLSVPWIVVGTWIGLWIGTHLRKSRLRVVAYLILVVTALVAICSPFV